MTHASLFSGIGGFDLAAEWMGWNNVLQCEIDPFCQKVLRYHFPSTHLHDDIKTLDGTKWKEKIDILTGGFPCQPFSVAGRRKGTDDNRFLWPEMLRVIREIQPTWIVAENVRGLLTQNDGMVFERVCSELENNGYEVQPFCIPACAIGAPHKRERFWFIGHSKHDGFYPSEIEEGCTKRGNHHTKGQKEVCEFERSTLSWSSPNPRCERWSERGRKDMESEVKESKPKKYDNNSATSNSYATSKRLERSLWEEQQRNNRRSTTSNRGELKTWDEHWLQAATRLCRVDDGLPRELHGITFPKWRRESLKAYGNAIVPAIAFKIFKSLKLAEQC